MKTKNVGLMLAAFVVSLSLAPAAFAEDPPPPPPPEEEPEKGNNGWGNGPDTTNEGSDAGGTAPTKSVNGLGADNFDVKFDGR